MQDPNKAVISPGLRGLMLVQQGLKELQEQGEVPAAGGLPTVLDQAKQAGAQALGAQQAPQQQMQQPGMTPPPQGPQAPEGGIAGIAQNAATGNNINDMKQKQAEQAMMQMAQQQQQQPTQMMASGGIAELPAGNMSFNEGGIIPYAYGGGIDLSTSDIGVGGASAGAPTPALEESPEIAAILAKEAQKQALNKARPDFYRQNIAALDVDREARAKAAAAQQERRGIESFMALVSSEGGMGGMGRASTQLNQVRSAREDAARQANLLDAQMRVKLGELEHARQIGDVNNEISTMKDITGIKHQMAQVAVQREGQGVQREGHASTANTAASKLAQEKTEGALDRELRERELKERRRIAELGLGGQEDKQNRVNFKNDIAALALPKRIADLRGLKHIPLHKIEYDATVKQLDDLAKHHRVPSDFARISAGISDDASAAPTAPAAFVIPPGYRIPPQK